MCYSYTVSDRFITCSPVPPLPGLAKNRDNDIQVRRH